eukprot:3185091-Alexandrium_andersonii.AAC.1
MQVVVPIGDKPGGVLQHAPHAPGGSVRRDEVGRGRVPLGSIDPLEVPVDPEEQTRDPEKGNLDAAEHNHGALLEGADTGAVLGRCSPELPEVRPERGDQTRDEAEPAKHRPGGPAQDVADSEDAGDLHKDLLDLVLRDRDADPLGSDLEVGTNPLDCWTRGRLVPGER